MSTHVHNRRNSSAHPYSIPLKIIKNGPNHNHSHNPHIQSPQNHVHKLSASVPSLSREFVVRRISEGESGRLKETLNCEACGKGYKHVSSLAKHLWEHTPEWNMTKKLLILKHQQVQLLEAALILVGMNDVDEKVEEKRPFSPKGLTFTDSFNPASKFEMDTGQRISERSQSISQHPPTSFATTHVLPGHVGGYLDVPCIENDSSDDEEIVGRME